MGKRTFLLLLMVITVILFFKYDLDHYLSIAAIKNSQAEIIALKEKSPLFVALSFFALYVLVTALSLPGAAVMTLAAGAFFGLGWGVLLVSFASSIGASLAFLVSRFLLRDWVQKRFGDRLAVINQGIDKEGGLYLFTLRLVPVFPFFMINLLMGLTRFSTGKFYLISQLGMLAGTIAYVNAGTQLGQLSSTAGILSPGLLFSFAVLGVFPFMAKRIITYIKRRQVYAQWRRPKHFDRNLIVIGAGAAGLVSAYIGAAVKAKVTLIEAHKMGGDCLNYGCVPSKALIKSASIAHQMRHADRYGLEKTEPKFSFKEVMNRVHRIIAEIAPHDSVERYTGLGVEVIQGYARLTDPWTVEITAADGGRQMLNARSIIIAAGAKAFVPPLPGIEDSGYLTTDTLWDALQALDELPRRMIVLGGGPIGSELAQSFARLGAEVTQIEQTERILGREDIEVSAYANAALSKDGVNILCRHTALRCEQEEERKFLVVAGEGTEKRLPYDALICAVGRNARLSGYGLEALGITTGRTIASNTFLETIYPNIYVAGDVAGPYQFTHVATHQAWYATVNALFGQVKKFAADYRVIPWTTFIDLEVARVGLNELEAKEKGIDYELTRYGIDDLDRAITDSHADGFIKVLTVPGKDKILGVTIVAQHAGELLAEYVLAMKHGLGLQKILGTIHTYPTMAEANKYVAGQWKRFHTSTKLLNFLQRYHTWRRT